MDAVPETFVDAFGEISLKHGMIRIELVSLSGSEPRVTQRLITSLQAGATLRPARPSRLCRYSPKRTTPQAAPPRPSDPFDTSIPQKESMAIFVSHSC